MSDEVYFTCKQAFQTLEGEELKVRLREIFTSSVVLEMQAKNEAFKDETRKMLNAENAKARRDKTRVRKFGPKKYKPPT
jgi:nucleoside diphosphate kinase